MSEKFGILGNGGQADEVELFAGEDNILFRAVTSEYIDSENLVDIINPDETQKKNSVIAAIGSPAVRKAMIEKWPGNNYDTVVAETAYVGSNSRIADGCVIAPRAVVTANVEIGLHSIINVGASISHDCMVGDYVTVGPGAHIGGNVNIGAGAFIGIGAIISNNLNIASGVVIGAGAVLVGDAVIENGVYVGVPAKLVRQNEGWLSEV